MKRILCLILLLVVCVAALWFLNSGQVEKNSQTISIFTGTIEQVIPEGFIVNVGPIEDYSDTIYDDRVTVVVDEETKVYVLGNGAEPWSLSGLIDAVNRDIADGGSAWIKVKASGSIEDGARVRAIEIIGL